ncbi:hypothetical protein [Aquibacillus rhizosphaerae]|uniref:Uncharacterized protein n=1 Tax=Aquibacillus rhizosphaerae TaxID=3051431 RepID=A0ABT7L0V7_9BACI|nr:hypothetical protein [Aquibacillus sp. LR5S19]MDL4839471.1 hypothetical protein [Aquibacillus sp. LR5S19]
MEESIELENNKENDSVNDETDSEKDSKYDEIDIVIEIDIYKNYFNNPIDQPTQDALDLIRKAAKSVSPVGKADIPEPENINAFFAGSNDELSSLFQKNNENNSQSELVMVLAGKPFALDQAADLIENEKIKQDLIYLANELFKIEFYAISDIDEFFTAYEKYVDIQKKILKIYYAINQ